MDSKKVIKITLYTVIIIAFVFGGFYGMKKFYDYKQQLKGGNNQENYNYNGFNFSYKDPLWITQIQKGIYVYTISLWNGPKDVENITFEGNTSQYVRTLSSKNITYVILDDWNVNDGVMASAVNEISQQFKDVIKKTTVAACSSNDTTKCSNLSMVKCNETEYGALYLTISNETKINAKGNCITITGTNSTEVIKATERLFYQFYGIIK